MLEEMEQKLSPSIQHIIAQNNKELKQPQINRLFKITTLPCFCTLQFKQHPLLIKNDIFKSLVRVLEDWNNKVEKGHQSVNSRAQHFRNQFIFTSLKNIMVQNNNVNQNLQRLYTWYRKNSSEGQSFITMKGNTLKTTDDDWDVRKTFRTNVPIQLSNYRRREFKFQYFTTFNKQTQQILMNQTKRNGMSQQQSRVVTNYDNHIQKSKDDEITIIGIQKQNKFKNEEDQKQNYRNYASKTTQWCQFKLEQQQIRRRRQQQQIKNAQLNWKLNKSRYQQHSSTDYYNGKFDRNTMLNHHKILINTGNAFQHIKKRKLDRFFGIKTFVRQNEHQNNNVINIDRMNLISNPFQVKPKTRKKK